MNSSKLRSSNTWRGKDLLNNTSQNSTPGNAFPPSHSNLRQMKLKISKILITNEQEVAETDKYYEVLSWLTLAVRHLLCLVEIQSCCILHLYCTTRDQLLCNYWLKAFYHLRHRTSTLSRSNCIITPPLLPKLQKNHSSFLVNWHRVRGYVSYCLYVFYFKTS